MAELTLTTNADRLAHKHYVEGLEKGREQGQREGRELGEREGRELGEREGRELGEREGREHGQRELLLHLLTRRFGPLTEATRQRVQALTSSEELSSLAERVLDARSLDDLGL
jgi:flagellar biosynthesis/type III secretory pathway protein FliH